jgi:carbamoyltransferase
MEFEYGPKDPDQFRGLHPWRRAAPWRVHTVPATAGSFRTLLDAFGTATGLPVLINTSFNGFHEPIVCNPRDAVRVFYGTGLDMLVIDNFVLQK